MTLRKIGCILLMVAMLTSLFASVAGAQATAEAREAEVLAVVRTRIGDTSRYTEFESSSRTAKNGVVTYRFDWWSEKESYTSLSVACTSGGVITEYSVYDSQKERGDGKIDIHKMSADEAMAKAKVLMDKLNPQLAGTLELSAHGDAESLYATGYTFEVQRVENGIPFYGQSGSISVNANADAIETFYISYDETVPIPEANALITSEAAKQAYAEQFGMKLVYQSYTKDKERIIYPIYVPASEWYMYISATTGKAVDMRSQSNGNNMFGSMAPSDSANKNEALGDVNFTPAEMEELEKVEGLLSSDAVLAQIRQNPLLDIPEEVKTVFVSRFKDSYAERYIYDYRLEGETYVYISADAKTGALLSFSAGRIYDADTAKNTIAQAEAAAKILAGDVFSEYRPDEKYGSSNGVRYIRYVNGVPYASDSISVAVHPTSNKVISFYIDYTDAAFPSVEGALTPAQASEKLFEQVDYTVWYMARYDANAQAHTELVYVLDDAKPQRIQPFTGALMQSYANEPYVENKWNGYSDIEGHYAQTQIETLARFGIRFDDGAYLPDRVITQSEFVSLLSAAFYNDGGIIGANKDAAYRLAASYGIVSAKERADDALVNRSSAAKYLICALGLDEVASLQGIYVCPFADVTENVGHISILNAMGVVRGDGSGNFNPGEALTRADAAILIYNYLSR